MVSAVVPFYFYACWYLLNSLHLTGVIISARSLAETGDTQQVHIRGQGMFHDASVSDA